jgi:glycosyltransferase involved in cell wall biosynthesis
MSRPHLAYIFERFPTFTQTFCVREILELERVGVRPLIFSIRDTRSEEIQHFPQELFDRVHFLPSEEKLVEQIKLWREANQLPQSVVLTLRQWGNRPDKMRVYEAAYIGHIMRQMGAEAPKHAHSHFAGIGARTCWWLRKFHGLSYSFTAHANDIFCKPEAQTPDFPALFADASLIVTVSDYTARQLRERFPFSAERVQRVYNGLDLSPFVEARAKANRIKALGGILSVGRLIEKKGYDDLITACGLLRDRGQFFKCRIIGEGPLESELKAQITKLKLQEQVELTGPRSMAEIVSMLAEQTQIFALACKTEQDGGKDNLPTVLMEAMAASLPCVSTRLAGVPEMVVDSVTGLLCNEGQPEQLAGLLGALLHDPAQCERMGHAGLEHAKKHFAKEVTVRHLLRAYARLSDIRYDGALASRERLRSAFLARFFKRSAQLGHNVEKVRDKSFDLARFMSRA